MKSIRRQLTTPLLIGLILLFAVAATALFLYTRDALIKQFDESLRTKLTSFAGITEVEHGFGRAKVEMEFTEFPIPEFEPSPHAEYYQLWKEDGEVFKRSPSLEEHDLTRIEVSRGEVKVQDLPLPDGRRGRAAAMWFTPAPENETISIFDQQPVETPAFLFVIARSREALDNTLFTLLVGYLATAALLIVGIFVIVRGAVGKGLAPLDRIASATTTIGSDSLAHRFPTEGLPDELVPISMRLNELLHRLESAFDRERRFNADIAHELRTPIAELLTLAEVALKRKSDQDYAVHAQAYFNDVLAIARQMEKLVTTLLALVRCEGDQLKVHEETFDVVKEIHHLIRPCEEQARDRKITVELQLPEAATIRSDKHLLSAILTNLFSNAMNHTPEGGAITCSIEPDGSVYQFSLKNETDQLTPDDMDHLFEPLWKKDPARSNASTNGLGLTLVAAYSGLLGLDPQASMPGPGQFEIRFQL